MTRHGIPADWIVTPEEAIPARTRCRRPAGIYREDLSPEKRDAIPAFAIAGDDARSSGTGPVSETGSSTEAPGKLGSEPRRTATTRL